MNKIGVFIFTIIFVFSAVKCGASNEAGMKDEISSHVAAAQLTIEVCRLKMQTEYASAQLLGSPVNHKKYQGCIKDAKNAVRQSYLYLRDQLSSNQNARTLLKHYLSFYNTAIDGILPTGGEPQFSYDSRQSKNQQTLSSLKNDILVELD